MRVAVIVPQVYNSINNAPSRWTIFPVEPASIATVLKHAGYDVAAIDLNMLPQPSEESLDDEVRAVKPDVAVVTPQWLARYDMKPVDPESFDAIKRGAPDCIRVNTGVQATLYPEMDLKGDLPFEYGLRGEVEETLPELLEAIAKGGNVEGVPGLFHKQNGKPFISDSVPSFDLGKMAAIDESLFDRRLYLDRVERGNFRYPRNGQPLSYTQTSRGCHYKCRFCSVIYLRDYSFRQKRLEVIFTEIENALAAGAKEIHFLDELFGRDRAFLEAFCGQIESRGLRFDWFAMCGLPVGYLDMELLQRLQKTGMYRVKLPLESANPRVLNRLLKKPYTVAKGWEVAQAAKKTGLETIAAFLVGMPGETRAEMEETVAMARELDLDYTLFSIATPIAGSQLETEVLAEGLSNREEIREKIRGDSVFFETEDLKKRDLLEVRWKVWSELNFGRPKKTENIARMFGIDIDAAAAMGTTAMERFHAHLNSQH